MKLIEKNITMDDLLRADEAFFTGTAVEITPISKIDSKYQLERDQEAQLLKSFKKLITILYLERIQIIDHWLSLVSS